MKHLVLRTLVAAVLTLGSLTAHADIFVVVNSSNSVTSLSQGEALDLFMGRSRHFANGVKAQPFDQARSSDARETFYRLLTGMDMAQVNSYWARLMFSGQTLPPPLLAGDQAVIDMLRRLPGGIGYLTQPPADRSLAVVLVLREAKDPR